MNKGPIKPIEAMKALKFITVCISIFFFIPTSDGQGRYGETKEDSIECIKRLNLYRDFRDDDQIRRAIPHWSKAVELCPRSGKKLYIDGENFYESLIEQTQDSAQKLTYIDSLMWVFDKRIEMFGQKGMVLGKKGSDLVKYKDYISSERLLDANRMLKASLDSLQEDASPNAIFRYYTSLYFLYKDEMVPRSELLMEYLPVSAYVRANLEDPKSERHKQFFGKVEQKVDRIFIVLGKCDTIQNLFNEHLEKDSAVSIETKRRMMNAMKTRECEDKELFPRLAKEVHEADPDPGSAYEIGLIEMENENFEEAANYIDEAIELFNSDTTFTNEERLLEYHVAAGRVANERGRSAEANEHARKALDIDEDQGRPYLIIADAISNSASECGENEMERKAVYWLAADYVKKAEGDTSLSDLIDQRLSNYRSNFPDKEMMFNYGHLDSSGEPKDEPFEIGCWIGESTQPRKSW